jgi:oxygen-independent coproporphyrinogen-3 oxidase
VSLSVYIHLPYCAQKCPYCDFNVHVVREIPERAYVDALEPEIDFAAAQKTWTGRPVSTVFFGGGTPSLFSVAGLAGLLGALDRRFGLTADAEVSLEANPEDLLAASAPAASWRAAGITRASIGGQSFDAAVLATLGRCHDGDMLRAAIGSALETGLVVSCDLIFAVPGQSAASWSADLATVTALGVQHVSTYNLTYEQGTPLTGLRNAGRIATVCDRTERELYGRAIETLTGSGYEHYEVSSFARPGLRCRHNSRYWSWRDYLGLGAGAHGFARGRAAQAGDDADAAFSTGDLQSHAFGFRYANVRQPSAYMNASAGAWAAWHEPLGRAEALTEFVLTGLRARAGFTSERFVRVFGDAPERTLPDLEDLVAAGLLEHDEGRVRLTDAGLLIADDVTSRLLARAA